jgi:regulator of replication initiation timing
MPYQRDYSKEIDSLKDQISKLVSENASLRLELNWMVTRLDSMSNVIDYIRTRVYPVA